MAEGTNVSKVDNARRNFTRFFREVRSELKKVIWPNREQLTNNTVTVLMACLLIGAIIWIFDFLLLKVSEIVFIR